MVWYSWINAITGLFAFAICCFCIGKDGDYKFNYKVYLSPEVNVFAMADGTIRIHSQLMDMMDDGELRFVIGHEMGHVVKKHIRKKIMLAYAGSALRKGIASQENLAGDISRSALGGFVETLLNAQFSQKEEREADDYGLTFLKNKGYDTKSAISALRKLAILGNNHTFLSSHPAPGKRADRLEEQLSSPEKTDEPSEIEGLFIMIKNLFIRLIQWIASLPTHQLTHGLRDYEDRKKKKRKNLLGELFDF